MNSRLTTFFLLATLSFSGYLAYKDPDFRRNNFEQIACFCLYRCSQLKEDDDDDTDKHDKNDKNGKDSKK